MNYITNVTEILTLKLATKRKIPGMRRNIAPSIATTMSICFDASVKDDFLTKFKHDYMKMFAAIYL